MKLISMTDFVLEQEQRKRNGSSVFKETIFEYAKFLKQPLTLGMFVPCDSDVYVLKKPKNYNKWIEKDLNTPYDLDLSLYEQYSEAKERVLFKNVSYSFDEIYRVFEIECGDVCIYYDVENDQFISDSVSSDVVLIEIECLSDMIKKSNKDIWLTESAIKQL